KRGRSACELLCYGDGRRECAHGSNEHRAKRSSHELPPRLRRWFTVVGARLSVGVLGRASPRRRALYADELPPAGGALELRKESNGGVLRVPTGPVLDRE